MVNQNKQKDSQEQRMTIESLKQVEFKENGDEALVDPVSPTVDSDDSINEDISIEAEAPTQEPTQQGGPIATTKKKINARKPAWLSDMVTYALPVTEEKIPTTYEEAVIHADSVECEKAMGEGTLSLHKNKTWELVQLPHGKR